MRKPTTTATLEIRTASDIPPSPTLWAIPNHLPRHHLSAIVAPTGAGLTTLATQICAHLAPIENQNSKIENDLPSVLLIPGRESIYSITARLKEAGVDLARILILNDVHEVYQDDDRRDSTTRHVCASDHRHIAQVLHEHKSIRLVLIDNAEDLFSTTGRPTRNKLLRQLACFQQVAESREVAITFLAAIPSLKLDPFRTGFLCALQHSARAVHLLAPDPESPKHRLLFTLKNTLSATHPTLRLDFAQATFPGDATVPELTYAGYLRLLRAPLKKTGPAADCCNYAIEVLRELLKNPGQRLPVGKAINPARKTLHYLIREAGLTFSTVLRAKEQLGIIATRDTKCWSWHFPEPERLSTTATETKTSAPPSQTCNSSQKSAPSDGPETPTQPPFPPITESFHLLAPIEATETITIPSQTATQGAPQ